MAALSGHIGQLSTLTALRKLQLYEGSLPRLDWLQVGHRAPARTQLPCLACWIALGLPWLPLQPALLLGSLADGQQPTACTHSALHPPGMHRR